MKTQINLTCSAKRILWIGTLGILTGCAMPPIPPYVISSKDITSIRSAHKAIDIGDFSGGPKEISCRTRPFIPEGGISYAQYIRDAFNDEVVIAGQSPTLVRSTISLKLINIDVDCGVASGSWVVQVEVLVGQQAPYTVITTHNFDGNFVGDIVLHNAAQAFLPTIQETIKAVIAHPTFKSEFGISQ